MVVRRLVFKTQTVPLERYPVFREDMAAIARADRTELLLTP